MEDRYELGSEYWDNFDSGYEKDELNNKSNEELDEEYLYKFHEKNIKRLKSDINGFIQRINYYEKIVSYYKRKCKIDTKIYVSMIEQIKNDTKEYESYKSKISEENKSQSSYVYQRYGVEILKRYTDSIESYTKQAEFYISLTGESGGKVDYFGKKAIEFKEELKISSEFLKKYCDDNDVDDSYY